METRKDKYNLERFVSIQNEVYAGYETALQEIKCGRKESHWIWYIFPQLKSLGQSYDAKYYGIENLDEAVEYLQHPVLGERLIEITQEFSKWAEKGKTEPIQILGGIDSMKMRSCMTLFYEAACQIHSPEKRCFEEVLDVFYGGTRCERTLKELFPDGKEESSACEVSV